MTDLGVLRSGGADTIRIGFDPDVLPTNRVAQRLFEGFEAGPYTIELDKPLTNGTYVARELHLEEDPQTNTPRITVGYTSQTETSRDMVFTRNATGVQMNDIVLLDDSTLEPAT
ncbi:hypothetical protein ABMC88_14095 [Sulfitobacter sp. HNIBRBA2951]|uniref:hypothetical protein n=1 Tax=Sulfitobacter aquimarinus TaxID=3158557 RepID=UPI0032DE5511